MKRLHIAVLLLICHFPAADCRAQDSLPADMEYVRRTDARIESKNPAGLKYLPVSGISAVETHVYRNSGRFVNYFQSDDSYTAGAKAESFLRMSRRLVFYGKAGYDSFNGKRMGGSAFIDPGSRAFDIQETTDSTRGDKSLESYSFAGAVSAELSGRLTLGGKIEYKAADYAKSKDLRHTNRLLDLTAAAGASYAVADGFAEIGVSCTYRRSVEGVLFKTYGTTGQRYVSLISFGSFYGRAEQFGDAGYTDPDSQNPAVDEWRGASIQLTLGRNSRATLFNELSYHVRKGCFGKRSPSTPVYVEHRAPSLAYRASLSLRRGSDSHDIRAEIEHENLKNNENIYRFEHSADGRSEIAYLGSNRVFSRSLIKAVIGYTASLNVENFRPQWTVGTEIGFMSRRQTVSMYPYRRRQNVGSYSVRLSAARNLSCKRSLYSVYAGILYGAGNGTPKTDDVYAQPAESQRPPRSNDVFLAREYEYLTAKRAGGSLGIEMRRTVDITDGKTGRKAGTPVKSLHPYARIDCELAKTLGAEYLSGASSACTMLSLGCRF